MKFTKACLGLFSLFCLFSLVVSGCVRIKVESPTAEQTPPPQIAKNCKVDPYDQQEEIVHSLRVNHLHANLTLVEANEILDKATKAAQEGNGNEGEPRDVACKIKFKLIEDIKPVNRQGHSLPSGGPLDCLENGEVCTKFDFNKIASHTPAEVKVVKDIRWCNFPRSGVDGCTEAGLAMLVRRMCEPHGVRCPTLEGISWLHEFGHIQGLYHRPNISENAVMNHTFNTFDVWLNPCECVAYRRALSI